MTQRLVQFQNFESRETPLLLLADLRMIDDTAELVYVGEGMWWLGAVRKTDIREETGRFIKKMEMQRDKPNPRNLALAELSMQGFARIEQYVGLDVYGVMEDGHKNHVRIVDDFRERDAHWRRDGGEEQFRRSLAESMGEPERLAAEATMKQYIRTDGRAHFHREIRNRVSFGAYGMTGGTGRIIIP